MTTEKPSPLAGFIQQVRSRLGAAPLVAIAKGVVLAVIWISVAITGLLAYYCYDLPNIAQVNQSVRRPTVTILAADGSVFARFGDLQGATIDVRQLPPHLIYAVLSTEDRRFFDHFGIDLIGLSRAMFRNLTAGRTLQGGSTITQQLAKNLFLSGERTFRRKVQEALLALWLERAYTKAQILSAYMNRVYLGAGTYGFDAAAQTYFGKPATAVTLAESAILAGLLKAPSRYSPANNPDEAAQRAGVVLTLMVDAGVISADEATEARRSLPATPRRPSGAGNNGRYFTDWIADQVSGYLGYEHEDVVVQTTLTPRVQAAAEARVAELMNNLGIAARVSQVAVLTLTADGAIRAMIGGREYSESQFNRATQALRQPGSAFKPIVYLAALEAGLSPDTRVDDAPLQIGSWRPTNFDKDYRGSITLREALAYSANTAAVRVLERAGLERTRSLAQRLGIVSPLARDMTLALGASAITPLELVGAYAAIANGGAPVIPYAITEIRDRNGQMLYQRHASPPTMTVAPGLAGQLARMMTGVIEYGTGRTAKLDRPAAAKTGTSQDYRDAWFVGFTAEYVTGVWLGNDDNAEMKRVTGGSLPAKLWRDIMLDIHTGLPPRQLPVLDAAGYVAPPLPRTALSPLPGMPIAPVTPSLRTPTTPTNSTPIPQPQPQQPQPQQLQPQPQLQPQLQPIVTTPPRSEDPLGQLIQKLTDTPR
ncbi:penicillin-binding protein 1A [Azospirillaceae bacterium]